MARNPADPLELPESNVFWRWVWQAVRPVLGWVLVGLGALALLLGYLGVSREVLVAKQLPFLVSGGLLGIALIVMGAMFLGTEDIRRDSGRLDRLETMIMELHVALLARPDAPDTAATTTSSNGHPGYVALPGGVSFHREGCPMLAGKDSAVPLALESATAKGLVPCPLCEPVPVGA